jgi:hypothetical protein
MTYHVLVLAEALRQRLLQAEQAELDRGERIPDLMRHTCRQHAERRQLFLPRQQRLALAELHAQRRDKRPIHQRRRRTDERREEDQRHHEHRLQRPERRARGSEETVQRDVLCLHQFVRHREQRRGLRRQFIAQFRRRVLADAAQAALQQRFAFGDVTFARLADLLDQFALGFRREQFASLLDALRHRFRVALKALALRRVFRKFEAKQRAIHSQDGFAQEYAEVEAVEVRFRKILP